MGVTRTHEIRLEPAELAELFCGMTNDNQAEFFRRISLIVRDWPGAGWCQQSCAIADKMTPGGREVISTLASHCLDRDQLQSLIEAQSV